MIGAGHYNVYVASRARFRHALRKRCDLAIARGPRHTSYDGKRNTTYTKGRAGARRARDARTAETARTEREEPAPDGASVNGSDRLGLDESLEAYAKRTGRTVDEARYLWRLESLRALRIDTPDPEHDGRWYATVTAGLCRIAPGVAVPTNAVTWSDEPGLS